MEELRPSDVLARHGGEEFALAMPGTDLEAAEAVPRAASTRAVPAGETCSGASAPGTAPRSTEGLLDRADTALYDAKAAGRDQVVVV